MTCLLESDHGVALRQRDMARGPGLGPGGLGPATSCLRKHLAGWVLLTVRMLRATHGGLQGPDGTMRGSRDVSLWQVGLGLAAEHGYFMHWPGGTEWAALNTSSDAELTDQHARWKELIEPIMQVRPLQGPEGVGFRARVQGVRGAWARVRCADCERPAQVAAHAAHYPAAGSKVRGIG